MGKKKVNKSKTYLLPLLSEFINVGGKFINSIDNVYLKDSDDKHARCIYLLYNFNDKDEGFAEYEHDLITNELFVDSYDIGNKVLYVFKFPEEYINEYEMYMKGKYSKFGRDAKELILDFWNVIHRNNFHAKAFLTKVKGVLFKEKQLKTQLEKQLSSLGCPIKIKDGAELGDIANMKNETYNFKLIKKH